MEQQVSVKNDREFVVDLAVDDALLGPAEPALFALLDSE